MQTKSRELKIPESWATVNIIHDEHEPQQPKCQAANLGEVTLWYPGYTPRSEVYSPNSGGKVGSWKPFEHVKSVQGTMTIVPEILLRCEWGGYYPFHSESGKIRHAQVGYHRNSWWSSYSEPYGDFGKLDEGLPSFYVPDPTGSFVPAPPGLDDLEVAAMRSMLPGIKPDVSLINSIYELKDMRGLVRGIVRKINSWSALTGFSRWYHTLTPKISHLSFKQLAQKMASGYLEYSFNLAPLWSDIHSVITACASYKERVNRLLSEAGRKQRRHFVWRFPEFTSVSDVGSTDGTWHGNPSLVRPFQVCYAQRWVDYDSTEFHAEIEFNYNLNSFQIEHAEWLGLLDSLGVALNPSIIWQAIPFSFVVDWVFGVQRYLDAFSTRNLEPQINICNYCWSVKRRRRIVVTCGLDDSVSSLGHQRYTLPQVTQSSYKRWVGMPKESSIVQSGLTLKEVSLGAALIVSRKRRRH